MSKLAIIYKEESDYHKLIKYNSSCSITTKLDNKKIIVLDGKFRDKDEQFFETIIGDPSFIDLDIRPTFTINEKSTTGYYMFIFENDYINEYASKYEITYDEAIKRISEYASKYQFEYDKSDYRKLQLFRVRRSFSEKSKKFSIENNIKNISSTSLYNYPLSTFLNLNEEYDNKIKKEQEKKKKYSMDNVDIKEIINNINEKIIKQDKSIKTLVCNIYFNQRLIDSLSNANENINNELDSRKVAILLDGATGVGKTALAKEIASKFNLPIVIENANAFSETGYVGATITDILEKLLQKANGDLALAQRGIVFLDEIDKIAKKNELDSTSMKLGVQKELLGFMSGGTYELDLGFMPLFVKDKVQFDTSKLTFIFAGAFTDMKEEKIEINNKKTIGFNNIENNNNSYLVDTEDYINFGLMREFFGRIKVISHMKTYTKEDLREILEKSSISPLKGFEKTCILFGAEGIEYNDEFISSVVDKAYDMGTNARALQSIMSSIQNLLLFDLEVGEYIGQKVVLEKSLLEEIDKEKVIEY